MLPSAGDILAALDTATCNICGSRGSFVGPAGHVDALDVPATHHLREGLDCTGCGSISRERAMMLVLGGLLREAPPLERWSARPDFRLLETSGYRGHPERLARLFDYFNVDYLPLENLPSTVDGRKAANLEDLGYPDGFFDVVLTAEVLEHVGQLEPALVEIHRVLSPDGQALIGVPYVHEWSRTSVRVHRWRDRDVLLYPPEYHADETLVYRIFGRDLLEQLAVVGFSVAYLHFGRPEHAVAPIQAIVASKAPFLDISPFMVGGTTE